MIEQPNTATERHDEEEKTQKNVLLRSSEIFQPWFVITI